MWKSLHAISCAFMYISALTLLNTSLACKHEKLQFRKSWKTRKASSHFTYLITSQIPNLHYLSMHALCLLIMLSLRLNTFYIWNMYPSF